MKRLLKNAWIRYNNVQRKYQSGDMKQEAVMENGSARGGR